MRASLRQLLRDIAAVLREDLASAYPDDGGTLSSLVIEDLAASAYDHPLTAETPADAESPVSAERQWVITQARRLIAQQAHRAPGWQPATELRRTERWLDRQPLEVRCEVVAAAVRAAQ